MKMQSKWRFARTFRLKLSLIALLASVLAIAAASIAQAQTYMFNRADFATGTGPETVAVGDFNGDGRLDVVVGNTLANTPTVSVLLGKNDGTFAPAVNYPVDGNAVSVAVGDFNGDGKLDIVAIFGYGSAQVSVLLGNGDGTFKPYIATAAGPGGNSIAVADFNGDGKLDIAISDNLESTEGVDVMLGNGDGTFKPEVTYATANDPRMVAIADFNGDGKLDLATINSGSQTISVLLGTGTGTFGTHADFSTGQAGCISIAAGSLRNNGMNDVVAGCQSLGKVVVLLGIGNGTFKSVVNYGVPAGANIVALGDFNDDGKLDVAVTGGDQVSVLVGSGMGKLKPAVPFGTNYGPAALATGDFNSDGKLDLVVADNASPFSLTYGSISVLLSNGKDLFAARADYSLTTAATSGAYSGLAAADLTGSGKPDLIVPVTFANQVSVLINKGSGTFKPFVTYPLPTSPDAVVAGDFNNDKKNDITIANFGGSPATISVLLNEGNGTFSSYKTYATGGYGYGIATGDFNKDGNLDIVTTAVSGKLISVLLGDGSGAFPTFATYAVGNNPEGVSVGDFNHDGFPDIAVANSLDGTVSILINKGDGTFLPQVTYTVGGNPLSIAIGSFRNSGTLDLAVTTDNAFGGLAILLGNNDGTFQKAVTYDTLNNAYGIVAGDFNNDGNLDLAISIVNSNTNFIMIMPGLGDGTFGNPVTVTAGSLPYGIVAADFNKDGGLDLATSNGTTAGDLGSATVLLNEPVIALFPGRLTFAAQKVGTTSSALDVTITNPGATPLKIISVTISGDFAETNGCPKTLAAGKSCTIAATFTPTATGTRSGTLSLKDKALSSVQEIALTGTGK